MWYLMTSKAAARGGGAPSLRTQKLACQMSFVNDVVAQKSVNDVLALINYPIYAVFYVGRDSNTAKTAVKGKSWGTVKTDLQ